MPDQKRSYIRHPVEVPILLSEIDQGEDQSEVMKNISRGGISCHSLKQLPPGTKIHIQIPLYQPPFETTGEVIWCHKKGHQYEVGIQFNAGNEFFKIRMVEQICHIVEYQKKIESTGDRKITIEEAALEWIKKYASDFPL